PALVAKVVHLLLDDVRALAHAAYEQLLGLEYRRPDLLEAEAAHELVGAPLQLAPVRALGRQDVTRAARGLDLRHQRAALRRGRVSQASRSCESTAAVESVAQSNGLDSRPGTNA